MKPSELLQRARARHMETGWVFPSLGAEARSLGLGERPVDHPAWALADRYLDDAVDVCGVRLSPGADAGMFDVAISAAMSDEAVSP